MDKQHRLQQLLVLVVLVKLLKQQRLQHSDLVLLGLLRLHQPLGKIRDSIGSPLQIYIFSVASAPRQPLVLRLQPSVALVSLKLQLQLRHLGGLERALGLQLRQPQWPPRWEASDPIPGCLVDWGAPLPSASLSSSNSNSNSTLSRAGMQLCISQ